MQGVLLGWYGYLINTEGGGEGGSSHGGIVDNIVHRSTALS